jgi:hypothetical protein
MKQFSGGTVMLRNTFFIGVAFFGLLIVGCASNEQMPADTVGEPPASSNPAMAGVAATDSTSTSPTVSGSAGTESNAMNQSRSSKNRMRAEVEEDTLETCVAGIPPDGTIGQRMLAEQSCRRNYAPRQ